MCARHTKAKGDHETRSVQLLYTQAEHLAATALLVSPPPHWSADPHTERRAL